jgi:hypothetical protein
MGAAAPSTFYRLGDDGTGTFFSLQVLEARDARIRVIDHFMTGSSHEAFLRGGSRERSPPIRG